MNWGDLVDDVLGAGLPLLGSALGGPAGAAVGKLAASALGVDARPEAVKGALSAPGAADRLKRMEVEHRQTLERIELEGAVANMADVNKTMRQEIASKDTFVRRARPTTIYVINLCILLQVIVGAIVIIGFPRAMPDYIGLIQALSNPLMVALGVVGVYKWRRTSEKMVDAGAAGKGGGLLAKIVGAVAGNNAKAA